MSGLACRSGVLAASALALFLLLLELAACHSAEPPSAQSLYDDARLLLQTEQLERASTETERGLALSQPGSNLAWNFRLLRAEILLSRREAKEASAALENRPPAGPKFSEQMARYKLCQAHLALLLHNSAAANSRLDEAQALAGTLPGGHLLAEIDLRRASLAIATRNQEQARQLVGHALIYAQAHGDRALQMSATGTMGYMLLQDRRYEEAVSWSQRTAALAHAIGAQSSEARAIGNLGVCQLELGELEKAQRNLRWAESRFSSTGIRYERQIWLGNLGNIEEANQEYDSAAADYAKALAISRDLGDEYWSAAWLDNLAVVSIERRDWDSAERYNDEALAHKQLAKDEESLAYSLVNTGLIANGRGQYARAEEILTAAVRKPRKDIKLMLDAHSGLAEAYAARGRYTAAVSEFKTALAVMRNQQAALLDESDKLSWFASVIRVYQEYVRFLMDRGEMLAALEVVESSRGRVLASRLGQTETRAHSAPGDLQRKAASSQSTLLVYFVGPDKSYVWAISSAGIEHYDLPGAAELQRLVGSYDDFLQQLHDPLREDNPAGQALYDKLIAPAHLTTAKVMLAPDGPLHSLNFATLPVSDARPPHYLLEDAEISVVPSFDLAPGEPRHQPSSLLLIGDPVSADADFPELTFAAQEMNGIQQRLPGVRHVMYARKDARPASYAQAKPQSFSWIHFVAHATANQDEPLQSAVILSRAGGADYRLFARDVVRIPLHAELVTISACHGAGAKIYQGEGLVGFSWAFLRSGARNVIAGLWDVNDRSTAELMAEMYSQLGNGSTPAHALRSAQLTLMRSKGVFRKPYYWGPFEVFKAVVE